MPPPGWLSRKSPIVADEPEGEDRPPMARAPHRDADSRRFASGRDCVRTHRPLLRGIAYAADVAQRTSASDQVPCAVATPVRKNLPVVVTVGFVKSRAGESGLELGRLVVDLDDRELAAVVEPPHRAIVGRRGVVRSARLRILERVDECECATGLQPPPNDPEERLEVVARDVAQPETGKDGVDLSVALGPRVANVDVRP